MNLNLYTFTGDPQELLARWDEAMAGFDPADFLLHTVSVRDDGITVLDTCPTEEDFQGWINGAAWKHIRATLGAQVEVSRLGELKTAIAREGVVDVVRSHVHTSS